MLFRALAIVLTSACLAAAQEQTEAGLSQDAAASRADAAIEEAAKATEQAVEAAEEAAVAAEKADAATADASTATKEAQAAVVAAEASGAVVENAEAIDWNGSWRSFWRGGQALLILKQEGSSVTGTYQPGDATVTGVVEGVVVRGTWSQAGDEGGFEFALAPDGQSFVGRSGNGEYWNGERLDAARVAAAGFGSNTPKAALVSLLSAANAAAAGDSFAELAIRRYLAFPETGEDLRSRNARVARLLRLLDLSTFRAIDLPETGEAGRATFELGPDGTDWTFPVEFIEADRDRWQIVVPPLETIERWEAAALEALAAEDFDDVAEARRATPRQTSRDFAAGTAAWSDGGAVLALATLDMSAIPEALRSTDGPLAAEYIRQIIDRVGYSIWQEVPDDPERRQPYVVYEHALGDIAIGRYPQDDGTARWLFTAESLEAAPGIFEAMQNLPLADGVAPTEPLTWAFKLRTELKENSPRLLKRPFLMENWQWIAIAGVLLVTPVLSWVLVRLGRIAATGLLRLGKAPQATRASMGAAFGWPARVFAAGAMITLLLREIELRQDVSAIGNGFAMLFMLLGGTLFIYRVVDTATVWLSQSAAKTQTSIDGIAVGLGGGLAKVAVLAGGIVLAAGVLGLPYEGVIAGLGIGGLAFAIASKDAVSNYIGAGILMSDRSFRKGDLIEGGGQKGIVEQVGMRSTRLRTPSGSVVVMPNAKLSDGNVSNHGKPPKDAPQPIDLTIGVSFETARAKLDAFVERLRGAFAAQPSAVAGASAALSEIGPSSLGIRLSGSFEAGADMAAARHKLLGDIVDLAKEMGVEFAVPMTKGQAVGPAVS
ncbi:MAG: mechanosensitive ion channel, partial [Rhodobacteraceae bacterium]|nr:mechanosensitive ion channel [Paracoccaceae bacterium]